MAIQLLDSCQVAPPRLCATLEAAARKLNYSGQVSQRQVRGAIEHAAEQGLAADPRERGSQVSSANQVVCLRAGG